MIKNDENGQAIMEFILFLPFMIMLFWMLAKISAGINGSINQQKITRGFFFRYAQHNSFGPDRATIQGQNFQTRGMYAFGWADKMDGETPVAPCYEVRSYSSEFPNDACDFFDSAERKTRYIRVKTVFGVCSASIIRDGSGMIYQALNISPNHALACQNIQG